MKPAQTVPITGRWDGRVATSQRVEKRPSTEAEASAASWADWVESQGPIFYLFARQQTRSDADAKDVLQDALSESWRRSGGEPPERSLVFKTIRRRAIDLGRSTDRRSRREERFANDAPTWVIPDYAENDTRKHLARAIEELPAKLREILVLRIWGELSFPEISGLIEISVPTATSRYRYALERLRKCEKLSELKP